MAETRKLQDLFEIQRAEDVEITFVNYILLFLLVCKQYHYSIFNYYYSIFYHYAIYTKCTNYVLMCNAIYIFSILGELHGVHADSATLVP